MNTKEKLLELFESNRNVYISGEDIAQKLGISRAAVWKTVKSLQNDGYDIDAVNNKGYCLSANTDILSPQGIRKYLRSEISDMKISVLTTTSSTNSIVRENINRGISEWYMVISNQQITGRGRLGRVFFSPKDTGIYMSLLLQPKNYSVNKGINITTIAAVAMCEAIEAISDNKAEIKWVNDIFINGKKVCGILTEGSFDLEGGALEYAILGIGINMYQPKDGFPKELESIASAIFEKPQNDAKNRLVSEFINRFYDYYTEPCNYNYIEKYRSRSFLIGKQVNLISKNEVKSAMVIGIDDRCRLKVKYSNGKEMYYSSGEISIKL